MPHPVHASRLLALVTLVAASPAVAVSPAATPGAGSPVILAAAAVAITAPGTVDPGQAVTVDISGGRTDGRLELWGPVDGRMPADRISAQPAAEGPAVVTAPLAAGSYELRYVDGAGRLLARFSLDVAATPIMLSLPTPFGAGYLNEVHWTGPGAPGDMIQIADPRTGAVVGEAPAVGHLGAVNVTLVRAPEQFGDFEVRYWSGPSRAVLRRIPVTIGEGIAWLRSPVEVKVGERFAVQWNGPAGPDDGFEIFDPATGTVLTSQPVGGEGLGKSATLVAPSRPGAYRVRFVNTATGFAFSDLPLDVDPK